MDDELEKLYNKIPHSECKRNCVECCKNIIQFSKQELKNMNGYDFVNGQCSHIINSKCSIYSKRPFVCRLYGASEILRCDACIAERFLTKEETAELMHEYIQIKNKQEK